MNKDPVVDAKFVDLYRELEASHAHAELRRQELVTYVREAKTPESALYMLMIDEGLNERRAKIEAWCIFTWAGMDAPHMMRAKSQASPPGLSPERARPRIEMAQTLRLPAKPERTPEQIARSQARAAARHARQLQQRPMTPEERVAARKAHDQKVLEGVEWAKHKDRLQGKK